jgi:hypothetical protein
MLHPGRDNPSELKPSPALYQTMPTKYDPEYYRANKERHQATMKAYYVEKKEERIAKSLAYYHAHRDEINAKRREKRAAAHIAID